MRHEQAFYVGMALKQVIDAQTKVLNSPLHEHCLSLCQEANKLAADLSAWLTGFSPKDHPLKHFLKRAQDIEQIADRISEEQWYPLIVNVTSVFEHMIECEDKAKTKGHFERRLKAHLDSVRLRLLEQIHGARLLENFGCQGEDTEKVLVDFLKANLPADVRVFRGGHIYDHEGNRSEHQIDIIVATPDALGFCPSEAESGKYNALVDHVVAAISVKSSLKRSTFEDCWNEIQGIPVYTDKEKDHPRLKNHAWPLCYIMTGDTTSLADISKKWADCASKGVRHAVQVLVSLNEGYAYPGNACWPLRSFNQGDPESHRVERNLEAGLGLGWILTGITGRVSFLNGRILASVDRMAKLLSHSELQSALPPTYDRRHEGTRPHLRSIRGKLAWGNSSRWLHNRLLVCSLSVDGKILENQNFPAETPFSPSQKYEERWFNSTKAALKGNLCVLEEWLPDAALEKINVRRDVVFDCDTGAEIPPERIAGLIPNPEQSHG